ncbi:hypothetical protein WOLCODRAFT_155606 [Wolfiporia cocos MD-104 SS10]|uniref:Uncharacterized protein n=1 Tax=Wolfiporia cocos (strain MD-104) TaxID=742152 RepID=A0A2H3IY82_WOLCO|nr:hypothetical protein WOLCODRAFT_155606 [Wolfiporia cocos MD-104 SS10]
MAHAYIFHFFLFEPPVSVRFHTALVGWLRSPSGGLCSHLLSCTARSVRHRRSYLLSHASPCSVGVARSRSGPVPWCLVAQSPVPCCAPWSSPAEYPVRHSLWHSLAISGGAGRSLTQPGEAGPNVRASKQFLPRGYTLRPFLLFASLTIPPCSLLFMLDAPLPALLPRHLCINLAAHQVDAAPAPTRDAVDAPHIPAPAAPVLPPVPVGDAARAAARAAPPLAEQVPAPVAPAPPAAHPAALPPLVGEPPAHALGPLAPPITNLFASPEELAAVRAAALSSADDGKVTPIPPIRKGYKGSPLELAPPLFSFLALRACVPGGAGVSSILLPLGAQRGALSSPFPC